MQEQCGINILSVPSYFTTIIHSLILEG